MHDHTEQPGGTSVLGVLRSLLPSRRLQLAEALTLAELQADRLLRLRGITDVPVPVQIVTDLPRIVSEVDTDLAGHAASGASDWDRHRRAWVISINPEEPATRQRFTVLHEYKHILDHGHPGLGGRLPRTLYGLDPVEYVAEYFAGCVLMPKRLVKGSYFDGIQRASELAGLFDVSPRAMQVRLEQLGLSETDGKQKTAPRYRLQPKPQLGQYHRPLSSITIPRMESAA